MRRPLDLRSDVLIGLEPEQLEAMRSAQLGWTYLGEDTNVNRLEALGAELLGKQAALFVPTCSMANLVALMSLGRRGTQVVLEQSSHIAAAEAWGLAYVCGLFASSIAAPGGVLAIDQVDEAMQRAEAHDLAGTSLLCLENTHTRAGGIPVTASETEALAEVARRHGAAVHLDGARLINAAVALEVSVQDLARPADTVSVSLNKGLGAPMGALLVGSYETIGAARLNLKRLGGSSIHRAGFFAAAAILALNTGQEELKEDHRVARELARRIAEIPGLFVEQVSVRTNIVVIDPAGCGLDAPCFISGLKERGVLAYPVRDRLRLVTHRDIRDTELEAVVASFAAVARSG